MGERKGHKLAARNSPEERERRLKAYQDVQNAIDQGTTQTLTSMLGERNLIASQFYVWRANQKNKRKVNGSNQLVNANAVESPAVIVYENEPSTPRPKQKSAHKPTSSATTESKCVVIVTQVSQISNLLKELL